MLTSLLPGLRELRAPLAAGYLWLAAGWLTFSGRFPDQKHATGLAAAVYRFDGVASRFGIAAAVTFTAYVVGTLSAAVSGILARGYSQSLSGRAQVDALAWLSSLVENARPEAGKQYADVVREWNAWRSRCLKQLREEKRLRTRPGTESWPDVDFVLAGLPRLRKPPATNDFDESLEVLGISQAERVGNTFDSVESILLTRVMNERDRIKVRLLGGIADRDLYQEIDRAEGEAEFRFSVAFAVVPFALAAAGQVSWSQVVWFAGTLAAWSIVLSPFYLATLPNEGFGIALVVAASAAQIAILTLSLVQFHVHFGALESPVALVICAGAVAVCGSLWWQGRDATVRATGYIVDALILDRVRAPSLESIYHLAGDPPAATGQHAASNPTDHE